MGRFRNAGMSGRELLDMLKGLDDEELELPIVVCYNYGDYHNTPAVDYLDDIQVRQLAESAYSRSGWEVVSNEAEDGGLKDEEDDESEDAVKAIVVGSFFEGGR